MIITLKNSFHNSTARVRISRPAAMAHYHRNAFNISPSQERRAWRKLCGIESCTCSRKPDSVHGSDGRPVAGER
jgi:hypothetical protein